VILKRRRLARNWKPRGGVGPRTSFDLTLISCNRHNVWFVRRQRRFEYRVGGPRLACGCALALASGCLPASIESAAPESSAREVAEAPTPRVDATPDSGARPSSGAEREARPRIRTGLTRESMLAALGRGHALAFGYEPWDARLAGAYALAAFENDHGAALYNFNFGNVEASANQPRTHWTRPDGSVRALRAYDTAERGAAGLWDVLRRRHGAALRAFDAADYRAAVDELARYGYFEADTERYRVALPQLATRALTIELPALRTQRAKLGLPWTAQLDAPEVGALDEDTKQYLP